MHSREKEEIKRKRIEGMSVPEETQFWTNSITPNLEPIGTILGVSQNTKRLK
jgi:hypothetical protein